MTTIKPSEIKVGDLVKAMPSKSSSGYSGVIYKVARVNIYVMSKYQIGHVAEDNPPIDLDLGKHRRYEIDFVNRNGKTFQVEK